jgi:hypothetical protein
MIARPQRSPSRLFPLLTAYGYTKSFELDSGTPDQQAAASLLSLAKLDLTQAQQFFAYKLRPQAHLTRLFKQHQLGLEAEQKAQWQRADFYWQQVQNQLKALSKREALWQALADEIAQKHPEAELLNQPLILRQRLVEEVLIDTHCGFYNGLTEPSEGLAWGDRPFTHIRHIEKLLPYSSLTLREIQLFLADSWQKQINHYRAAKNWSEAIKLCHHRLTYCSDIPYQNELAEMQASAITAKLTNGKSEKQQLQDAKRLKKGIQQFEALAKIYPHNISLFDYLGNLHHLHAIRLGNGGLVAEGLVAVEKALIYTPYLRDAVVTRSHLTQAMERLSEYATQVKAQLARNRNTRLNPEGRKVLTQSQKGFALREWYLNSKYASSARKAVQVAEAMTVWRNIQGLPDPSDEQQAIALLNGLNTILKHPPANPEALPAAWQTVVKAHPELTNLNAESIHTFLKQRIWKVEPPTPIVTPTSQTEQPPLLKPFHATPQPSREPFLAWICSRQNLGLKAQTAIATIALLIVGNLSLYELSVRTERKTAYNQILTLDPQQDSTEIIAAAEQFLSHRPLSGKDAREARVKELYTQAFVNWFLQQPDALNEATTQAQFERYQNLTQTE